MYKAILSYDGTRYFGWQKTKAGPSIQQELERAISQITSETPPCEAASRTDRGVHAEGQVVQFALTSPKDPQTLLRSLNAVLPKDIQIKSLLFETFHPTLDALGKEYHYRLSPLAVQPPMERLYTWHFPRPIDPKKMERGMRELLGRHDFTGFANEKKEDPICTMESVYFDGGMFRIRGDRFLYKMVRNIVGTLLYMGCGKLPEDTVERLFFTKDRKQGGITAPSHGLYLHQVFYPLK